MKVLINWSSRIIRENPIHTIFTIIYLTLCYTMLISVKMFVKYSFTNDATDGAGMLWYVGVILEICIVCMTFLTMYNAFMLLIRERKQHYHLLSDIGATERQIRSSLFLEALMINCIAFAIAIFLGVAIYLMLVYTEQDVAEINNNSFSPFADVGNYYRNALKMKAYIEENLINLKQLLAEDKPINLEEKNIVPFSKGLSFFMNSLNLHSTSSKIYEGLNYVSVPQRSFYFLILEFLTVPFAMAMALRKRVSNGATEVKRPRKLVSAEKLPLHGIVRRFFGIGGEMNRLMDRRERARRNFFLSVFIIGIASLAIILNTEEMIKYVFVQDNNLYLRTFGDDAALEQRLDEYLAGEDFKKYTEDLFMFRSYIPRVYYVLEDGQISGDALDMLKRENLRCQPRLYPVSENSGKLVLPQIIFLNDDAFDYLRERADVENDVDALLIPGETVKGENFRWLRSDGVTQTWTLSFYTDEKRFGIDDIRTKNEPRITENNDNSSCPSDKIRTEYAYKNADAFLRGVQDFPTEKIEVCVREISDNDFTNNNKDNRVNLFSKIWNLISKENEDNTEYEKKINLNTLFWKVDRYNPNLVFPERAREKLNIGSFLRDNNEGLRLSMKSKGIKDINTDDKYTEDNNRQKEPFNKLFDGLRSVMIKDLDGCVAEHPLYTGTRYLRGDKFTAEETAWEIPIFYDAPHPIYADMYLRNGLPTLVTLLNGCLFFAYASIVLMLFTMLTNGINLIFGHHSLRRHEYAVLQSCGMSEKQTRRAILYEAVWLSIKSMVYAVGWYMIIYPPLLATTSFGAKYELVQNYSFGGLVQWFPDSFTNIVNIYYSALYWLVKVWYVFPSLGITIFVVFLLINAIIRQRMSADTLILLLKKDLRRNPNKN